MFLCTGLGVQDAALAWAVVERAAAERAAGHERWEGAWRSDWSCAARCHAARGGT